jgi:cell division protein FtsI (penicillin-binding protein 3)
VISERTAEILTEIMEQVVERGTGTGASLDEYRVAGKTGTTSRIVDGEYSDSEYNASFVGFVPSRQPIFTIVAIIESPQGPNGYYGGRVAGPMFKRVAEAALLRYGIPPTINTPPPILVTHRTKQYEQQASGLFRLPELVSLNSDDQESGTVFPNLKGLSARDAIRVLTKLGMNPHLHGVGVVVAQQPEAGMSIELGSKATLWLGRRIQDQIVDGSQP